MDKRQQFFILFLKHSRLSQPLSRLERRSKTLKYSVFVLYCFSFQSSTLFEVTHTHTHSLCTVSFLFSVDVGTFFFTLWAADCKCDVNNSTGQLTVAPPQLFYFVVVVVFLKIYSHIGSIFCFFAKIPTVFRPQTATVTQANHSGPKQRKVPTYQEREKRS